MEGSQEEEYFSEEVYSKFPHAMGILAISTLVLGTIGSCLIT